jgi:hypothetical protein
MKYASALSLVPTLRARAVLADRIAEARGHLVQALVTFTPDIELCPFDADVLWASMQGLRSLYGTEDRWSREVGAALKAEGFIAVIVVGFTRFGTYCMARTKPRSCLFASREQEEALMGRSPVIVLPLPQRVQSMLRKLDIHTIRQFVSLPEGEIIRRFGKEAGILRQAILSDDSLPIQPVRVNEKVRCSRHLDTPLVVLSDLIPHIEELLAVEAERAETARSVISGLTLVLRSEDGEITTDLIRPAVPTLSLPLLKRLISLRLSTRQFSSGIEDIEIRTARTPPSRTQEELFVSRGRDLKAGVRAIAAIRARFGDDAVTCAQLNDSWLPEHSFRWVPLTGLVVPAAREAPALQSTVRRILYAPRQTRQVQPGRRRFLLSGQWWGSENGDAPFHREYLFQKSESGVLWLYTDTHTGGTWVQGVVD